jgi:TonB-dependent receptor
MNAKNILLIGILVCFAFLAKAQETGIIRGTLTEQELGEPVMFGNVFLKDDPSTGAETDLEGKFELTLPIGTYTIQASYIGLATSTITDVEVKAGEITVLDILMAAQSQVIGDGEEIVVTASAINNTENAVLTLQRKATTIQDGISAKEISRFSAGNAADAMKRVTGASVVDGKYVFVRGLGDRYSSAQLNGQQLPSTDPYRNSMQLDLIPSNLLDNVIASKTFSPDQPGNFTGGNVNLVTKSFPEQFTLSASASISYNTQSSLRDDFLTHEGGATDWLGYDDGTRAVPEILTTDRYLNEISAASATRARGDEDLANFLDQTARSLSQQHAPTFMRSGLNQNYSISFGNQYKLGEGVRLGLIFGGNFRRTFDYYNNGVFSYWENTDSASPSLNIDRDLRDSRSTETPQLGGFASASLKFGNQVQSKISLITIYNHTTDKDSRVLEGPFPAIISGNGNFQTRTLRFRAREFQDYQLGGEHVFGESGVKFEWGGSFVQTTQDDPDFRQFSNTVRVRNEMDTLFFITPAEFDLPFHFYRTLRDEQYTSKADLTIPFAQGKSGFNQFKFGFFYSDKDRTFRDNVNQIQLGNAESYMGDPDAFFGDDNIGVIGFNPEARFPYTIGLYPINFKKATDENSYDGFERITAYYGMVNYDFDLFKVIAGLRVEQTNIFLENLAEQTASIEETDFLPSLNIIYPLTEDMNIRASFNQTLARPNMRELAPFESFDFGGDFRIQGNPELDRTLIQNYDLRWELYPRPGELFAVSAYYKNFDNPIITAFVPQAANPLIQYGNVDNARVYGLELEFRKKLDFISPALEKFKLSSNFSLIESVVDIPDIEQPIIDEFIPEKGDTRPFPGQSPFLLNAALNYNDFEKGWDAIIAFNVFGARLYNISEARNPDIYEQPRPQLDISVSKTLTKHWSIKVTAQNLLNPNTNTIMTFKGQEYDITRFRRGTSFGLKLAYTI